MVISRMPTPPAWMASATWAASSAERARMTGISPTERMRSSTSALSTAPPRGLEPLVLGAGYRATRADPPRITRSTSERRAMVVSPGVVMARAPWAAPQSTAHWGSFPARKP